MTPTPVVIITAPKDWTPQGPDDLPPGVVMYAKASEAIAESFAEGFNRQQMKRSSGQWAVTPAMLPAIDETKV